MAVTKRSQPESEVLDDEASETPAGNRLTRLLFRPRILMLLALAVSSTFFVPIIFDWLPNLSARSEYRLPATGIEFTAPPQWVPADFLAQVIQRAGLPVTVSLLDEGLTAEIAEAFRLHPWVAEVVSVRKSAAARIEVELVYRKPVAMVQVKQGKYPVDSESVLLPPADFSVADTGRFPTILNVHSTPQGPAGMSWGDPGVLGAARLAEILAPQWKTFDLVAIRVPRPVSANTTIDNMTFQLVTKGGSRIIWGRVPGTGHPGELTAQQKIGRLTKYLSEFRGFDNPHGPYEIDIRHWREISRRPLSSAGPRTRGRMGRR